MLLYLTDNIDEFALQVLHAYNEKEFKSVSADDLDLGETTEEKEQAEKQAEESKDLLEAMKDALGEHIHSFFLKKKRAEWERFNSTVTEWELRHYLANS